MCHKDLFDGLYRIYKDGSLIKTSTGKKIKAIVNKNGYKTYSLSINKKRHNLLQHRLLAQAFIENPENKPQINHKDAVKTNNNLSNLEWCTASENTKHCHDNGCWTSTNKHKDATSKNLAKARKKAHRLNTKYTEELGSKVSELLKSNISKREIGRRLGLSHSTINNWIKEKQL